jgi:CHAT domain-containing protein
MSLSHGPQMVRAGDMQVLFVLDGALHSVPFAALRPPHGMLGSDKQPLKFLLQHINMAVAPSITVAGLCGRRWKDLAEQPCGEGTSCIVGDPNNDLEGARAEALLVAADYGGRKSALLGSCATQAVVIQRMRPAFLVRIPRV